jgi:hypothetical protein
MASPYIQRLAREIASKWLLNHSHQIAEAELANTTETPEEFDTLLDPLEAELDRIADELASGSIEQEERAN